MKRTIPLILLLASGLLAVGGPGCKRQAKTLEQAALDLQTSLKTASKEVQHTYFDVVTPGLQYGKYQDALAGLSQIANDPSVTPEQKKLANQFADMLKAKTGATNQ